MEISIIVPVYNVEDKLERCINSILSQTFQDFELLLIDDGSTDNSPKICDEFAEKDQRVKAFHINDIGVSATRNLGLDKAKGKYIGFVDSDDYISDDYFYNLYTAAEKESAEITMCGFALICGSKQGVMLHGFDNSAVLCGEQVKSKLYKNIIENNTIGYFSLWNKLFLREFIEKNKLRLNEQMSFGEDMCFVLDCIKYCNKMCFINTTGYFYEQSAEGLFSRYRKSMLRDALYCYEKTINDIGDYNVVDTEYIQLTIKYWGYVLRHLQGVIKNEKNKRKELLTVLKNETVQEILKKIASLDVNFIKENNIDSHDLRLPKLIASGHKRLAVEYLLYVDFRGRKNGSN